MQDDSSPQLAHGEKSWSQGITKRWMCSPARHFTTPVPFSSYQRLAFLQNEHIKSLDATRSLLTARLSQVFGNTSCPECLPWEPLKIIILLFREVNSYLEKEKFSLPWRSLSRTCRVNLQVFSFIDFRWFWSLYQCKTIWKNRFIFGEWKARIQT